MMRGNFPQFTHAAVAHVPTVSACAHFFFHDYTLVDDRKRAHNIDDGVIHELVAVIAADGMYFDKHGQVKMRLTSHVFDKAQYRFFYGGLLPGFNHVKTLAMQHHQLVTSGHKQHQGADQVEILPGLFNNDGVVNVIARPVQCGPGCQGDKGGFGQVRGSWEIIENTLLIGLTRNTSVPNILPVFSWNISLEITPMN